MVLIPNRCIKHAITNAIIAAEITEATIPHIIRLGSGFTCMYFAQELPNNRGEYHNIPMINLAATARRIATNETEHIIIMPFSDLQNNYLFTYHVAQFLHYLQN